MHTRTGALSPQAADVAGHPASQADEAEPSPHEAALAVRVGRRVISGMLPPYVMYGLQFGVAVAIATILVVLQPVWVAMSGSSRWIVVTLVIMHMPTIGAMTWKVFNRVGGTVLGCAVAYLQLALAFLINGASWDNSVGKMIVIAVCTSVWASFCQLNGSRFPPYLEFWRGAGLTASLLALPVYRTDSAADWTQPGWRFVAVCIGSAIMALISAVVFPVTARAMARHKLAAALSHVAGLCSRLQTQVGRRRRRRACWYGRLAPAVCCAIRRAGCLPQVRGPALHHLTAQFEPETPTRPAATVDEKDAGADLLLAAPEPALRTVVRQGRLQLLRMAGAPLFTLGAEAPPALTDMQLEACPQLRAYFGLQHLHVLHQSVLVRMGGRRQVPTCRRVPLAKLSPFRPWCRTIAEQLRCPFSVAAGGGRTHRLV